MRHLSLIPLADPDMLLQQRNAGGEIAGLGKCASFSYVFPVRNAFLARGLSLNATRHQNLSIYPRLRLTICKGRTIGKHQGFQTFCPAEHTNAARR